VIVRIEEGAPCTGHLLEKDMLLTQKPDKLFSFSAHLLVPDMLSLPLPWLVLHFPGETFPEVRSNRFVGLHSPLQDHAEKVPGATVVRGQHFWQAERSRAGSRARATAHGEKKTGGRTDLQGTQGKQTLRSTGAQKRHQE